MITSLTVKNIALIEQLTIDFEQGLNVLSGETGAGKSIIIGALGFLFGGKSDTETIRQGTDEASVAGTFDVQSRHAKAWLSEHGIDGADEDIVIRRSMKSNGRSSAWINSTPVSKPELEEFTALLVDIHGQHDHQSLFRVAEHRRFLDAFAGLENEVAEYSKRYTQLMDERKRLEELQTNEAHRTERIDYLKYAIDEITKAKLQPDEDVQLEAEAKKLDSFEKLFTEMQEVVGLTTGESGAVVLLKKAMHTLTQASELDKTLSNTAKRIQNQYYELEDACADVESYFNKMRFDEARRDEVQERLAMIYKLKKKYAATDTDSITQILQFAKSAAEELETLEHSEEGKQIIEKNIKELQVDIFKRGSAISKKRIAAATKLEAEIEAVLKKLGMAKTVFKVSVAKKEAEANKQKAGPYGFDDIEFLISPNQGEALKPLIKIASGGELSRVMLAIKTVMTAGDDVDTLIFDEIDTGIGGEVALSVAEHMKELSAHKQILCVTHLAVIASHAANQIKIAKSVHDGKTYTQADKIIGEARTEEIARMLSGDEDSSVSIMHARELLKKYAQGF